MAFQALGPPARQDRSAILKKPDLERLTVTIASLGERYLVLEGLRMSSQTADQSEYCISRAGQGGERHEASTLEHGGDQRKLYTCNFHRTMEAVPITAEATALGGSGRVTARKNRTVGGRDRT